MRKIENFAISSLNKNSGGTISYERYKDDNQLGVIIINNPTKRGAISAEMMLQFANVIDELEGEMNPPMGLVFASSGQYFSAGLDLNLAKNCINTNEIGAAMQLYMSDATNRLRALPCISVTVIDGPALGGGMELITSTDYRIMRNPRPIENIEANNNTSPNTSSTNTNPFIQSVHAMIGATPGFGGAARLVSIVGRRHALRILGSSTRIQPWDAMTMGLVDTLYHRDINYNGSSGGETTVVSDIDAGYKFLKPFLEQPFSSGVHAMKNIVHAADADNSEISESKESLGMKKEREVFTSRWFGEDNRKALGLEK